MKNRGFTIVELLVVIVVIGILAAITIVSYAGISQKATAASLQSDLTNSSNKLKMYQVEYGSYPTMTLDGNGNLCPSAPSVVDTKYCIKPTPGNTFTYSILGAGFGLIAAKGTTAYTITNNSSPVVTSNLDVTDPTNWLAIGTQVWAKYNLNVGTMVTGVTDQTNNATLEKYCYSDTESNCTTYGGLYQWDEAMQYVTTEGAQGICPANSHIPTDAEYKTLEMQLGMTQVQADVTGWRGTNQGTQLKSGGSSGLNMLLAGNRNTDGSFSSLSLYAYLWLSSESSTRPWYRYVSSSYATVYRTTTSYKVFGFSVRCLGN